MTCRISFTKSLDVLRALTCARALGNPRNICLRIDFLKHVARTEGCIFLEIALYLASNAIVE